MRRRSGLLALLSALLLGACASAPPVAPAPLAAAAGAPAAPAPAAAKKFSMRMYYMAILRRGPRWTATDSPERKHLLEGHMRNIRRLGAEGKLVIAGPFDVPAGAPADTPVGIFIFDVAAQADAEALVQTDPTIAAGHFAAQVLPWYGPSGLSYDGRDEELTRARAEQR
jgi:uncharacterized protein YciI